MRKLDRYIGQQIFLTILVVLAIIVSLALLFSFIDELDDVEKGYTMAKAGWYVFLTLPQRLYEMLPMAALIGCLIGLGSLASNSELTIMRAAGVSITRIVWAVIKPLLVIMLIGLLIGEYWAPWSENLAQSSRSLAQGKGMAQSSKHGLWHRQGNEYIHINTVQPHGVLYGVTRYTFDKQRHLKQSSFSTKAFFKNKHWLLEHTTTTKFLSKQTKITKTAKKRWDIDLNPELLKVVVLEPDTLSISGLWRYIQYLSKQGLNNSQYLLAFWNKVLQPFVTGALVLLAISFVFGPLRSVTLGQRVFTGVLVGFSFKIAQDLLGPSSLVFGFPPLLAILLPGLLCAVVGLILLRRAS